jgi:hypothetical protein
MRNELPFFLYALAKRMMGEMMFHRREHATVA